MDSEFVSPWQGALAFQIFGQPAEHVPSAEADQQKKIIAKMDRKMPGKSNDGKRKKNERENHNNNGGRSGGRQGIMAEEDVEDAE
jgi:hypothetical protein